MQCKRNATATNLLIKKKLIKANRSFFRGAEELTPTPSRMKIEMEKGTLIPFLIPL